MSTATALPQSAPVIPFGYQTEAEILSLIRCSECGRYNLSDNVLCSHCFATLSGPSGSVELYLDGNRRILDFDTGFLSPEEESRLSGNSAGSEASRITAMDVLEQGPLALLRQNRNWLCLLCGPTGTGKTYSAIRMAEMMDRHFSVDKIAFTILETIDLMECCSKGDFIIFDEGQAWNARRSMQKDNVLMGELLAMVRFTQINFIFALPHMNMIDKNNRRLIHNYLHTIPIDRERGPRWKRDKTGVFWYNVESERIPMHGDEVGLKYRYPYIKGEQVQKVWLTKADESILEEYERQKNRQWKEKLRNVKSALSHTLGSDEQPQRKQRAKQPTPYAPSTRRRSRQQESTRGITQNWINEILARP